MRFDIAIAVARERIERAVMNSLKQQNFDLLLLSEVWAKGQLSESRSTICATKTSLRKNGI
jgi:hypothetical protein